MTRLQPQHLISSSFGHPSKIALMTKSSTALFHPTSRARSSRALAMLVNASAVVSRHALMFSADNVVRTHSRSATSALAPTSFARARLSVLSAMGVHARKNAATPSSVSVGRLSSLRETRRGVYAHIPFCRKSSPSSLWPDKSRCVSCAPRACSTPRSPSSEQDELGEERSSCSRCPKEDM